MHNNIMAAGSRDRPPMLATGRYAQWRSRFLRYIDTRPNGDALRKCILTGPYYFQTMSLHQLFRLKSTSNVDACQTAQEMWEAIERFYKMMNEMIRNNLTVATMQVNVQFLQQLQPEWSRFVTIVKQQHKLDEVSYSLRLLYIDTIQKEVNELRAERNGKNANPLHFYKKTRQRDAQTNHTSMESALKKSGLGKTVGGPVVQTSGIQSFNCKDLVIMCSTSSRDSNLTGSRHGWRKLNEQELEAHYSYMAKIQEVLTQTQALT
ncbi:hypothetical protein Tco_0438191 [Tanacetum coccineum]